MQNWLCDSYNRHNTAQIRMTVHYHLSLEGASVRPTFRTSLLYVWLLNTISPYCTIIQLVVDTAALYIYSFFISISLYLAFLRIGIWLTLSNADRTLIQSKNPLLGAFGPTHESLLRRNETLLTQYWARFSVLSFIRTATSRSLSGWVSSY